MKSIEKQYTNQQIQVILTGKFGDGCLATSGQAKAHPEISFNYYYSTNSIHQDYLAFKMQLLGDLCRSNIRCYENRGYKRNKIFSFSTVSDPIITEIAKESIEQSINRLDELGFALWVYDDGSLHQKKQFYNLNTQAFSKEENYEIIVPFLKSRFGITATPTIERKQDGKEYWYLRIKKYDGAFIISDILEMYPVSCFNYKSIDLDTRLRWKEVEELSEKANIDLSRLHPKTINRLIKSTII